jgi:hypothetical protein
MMPAIMVPTGDATDPLGDSISRWSGFDLARRIGWILTTAAEGVDIESADYGWDFERLADAIIIAAQGGRKLPPAEYRRVWQIRALLLSRETAPDA